MICLMALSAPTLKAQTRPATQPATQPASDALGRKEAYFRKTLIDAYEKIGSRNLKWDEPARRILELGAKRWMGAGDNNDLAWQIVILGKKAAGAGCDDPAVLECIVSAHVALEAPVQTMVLRKLDHKVFDCNYAAYIKVFALRNLLRYSGRGPNQAPHQRRLLQGIDDNLPTMLSEANFLGYSAVQLCNDLADYGLQLEGDRQPAIDKYHGIMEKSLPDNSPVPDLFLASAYWRYSWEAPRYRRPDAPIASWDYRHNLAKEACERALKKDPHCADASARMVGLLVDEGSIGEEMEKYFQHAITSNPNCHDAYHYKAGALNTGGPDSENNLLAFGRLCLATKQWPGRIPFQMLRAHSNLAYRSYYDLNSIPPEGPERDAALDRALGRLYEARPDAWQDVQTLYEGYFAFNPSAMIERINYAKKALIAHKPDIAEKQLKDLQALATDPVLTAIIAEQAKPVRAALEKLAEDKPMPK